MIFQWDRKNNEHVGRHNVTPAEAEYVVQNARAPYPAQVGEDKLIVRGATSAGRMLQVIFAFKSPRDVDYRSLSFEDLAALSDEDEPVLIRILHAMELTSRMRRQYRRRRRP